MKLYRIRRAGKGLPSAAAASHEPKLFQNDKPSPRSIHRLTFHSGFWFLQFQDLKLWFYLDDRDRIMHCQLVSVPHIKLMRFSSHLANDISKYTEHGCEMLKQVKLDQNCMNGINIKLSTSETRIRLVI